MSSSEATEDLTEVQNYRGRVENGRVVVDVGDGDHSFCSRG